MARSRSQSASSSGVGASSRAVAASWRSTVGSRDHFFGGSIALDGSVSSSRSETQKRQNILTAARARAMEATLLPAAFSARTNCSIRRGEIRRSERQPASARCAPKPMRSRR